MFESWLRTMASLLDCQANAMFCDIDLQHCTMENVCFGALPSKFLPLLILLIYIKP